MCPLTCKTSRFFGNGEQNDVPDNVFLRVSKRCSLSTGHAGSNSKLLTRR